MKMTFSLIAACALLWNGALAQAPAPTEPTPAAPPPAPVVEPPAVIAPPAAVEKKAAPADAKSTKKKTTPKKAATAKPAAPAAPEPPDNPTPATVKSDRVNVRGKASLIGEVVTQLKKGESITVLAEIPVKSPKAGEPAAWAKIAMPANVPVWIHASYIDAATKTVKAARLNVRAGPGENFSVIGHIKKGGTYKDLRQIDDWIEIETPPGTFGYIAADLLAKGAALTATTPAPEPAPPAPAKPVEPVKVEPTPAPAIPTDVVPPPKPATEPVPVVNDPPAPAPVVTPAPEEPLPRRFVTREGIVRYTVSLRAPSQFSLVDADSGRTIAYLITDQKDLNFHHLVHQRYVLTGEEFLDKRWNNRTVLKVDKVEAAP